MVRPDIPYAPEIFGSTDSGYQLGQTVRDRFTAYVCRNDYTAIGLCRGLQEAGLRVPEDMAVVGQGDLELSAYFTQGRTAPNHSIRQGGYVLRDNDLGPEISAVRTLNPAHLSQEYIRMSWTWSRPKRRMPLASAFA